MLLILEIFLVLISHAKIQLKNNTYFVYVCTVFVNNCYYYWFVKLKLRTGGINKEIVNKSLAQGKYPSTWKIAHVIAIFKKGDSSLPSNYRPISLISCVGRVMEKVIYKHVYKHLHSNNLIYQYQSGFLPEHSTVHQLIELHNTILNSLENKEFSCFVSCDFSKAFDKVWHNELIHKMNSYGIKGNLLSWFKNYIHKRKQKVVYHRFVVIIV